MKRLNRITALVLVLAMVAALFCNFTITASAATYRYNTGTRHELCTSLSAQATAYYTGDYTWEKLSALPGSSSGSSLKSMDSDLYTSLHNLMSNSLTYQCSYNGSNGLQVYWPYTDAVDGTNNFVTFYADGRASTWTSVLNREHVWPKSRGSFYQKYAGCDLHHLRPTNSTVNSTRGNYTMGDARKVSSSCKSMSFDGKTVLWYDSSFDIVEVNDNIKGDVARIMLYVYVTWEQPNLFENVASSDLPPADPGGDNGGNNGKKVMWDLPTLLEWMEIDPVDTWEMGRNDIIEDIQGNRNVFIDYPELAWMLFNEELPSDYDTPSGYARENGSTSNFTVTAESSNPAWGTVTVSGRTVVATPAEGYAVSGYTLTPENAATVTRNGNVFTLSKLTADVKLTVQFAAKSPATVTYSVPAGVTASAASTQTYIGESITLPTVSGTPNVDDGNSYRFVGWVTSPVADSTDATALNVMAAGDSYAVTGNTTLYALFSYMEAGTGISGDFTLVTQAPKDWSGTYVIASESAHAMSNDCAGTYMVSTDVTVNEDDTIHTTDTSIIWTITRQSDGTYTIQDNNGLYLSCAGSKNVTTVEAADGTTSWQLNVDYVAPADSSKGTLQYNSSSPRFTTYTSTQTAVSLYVGSTGTQHYTTLDGEDPCANGHSFGAWTVTKAATCTEKGEETRTCVRCGKTETREVEALGHDWSEWKVTKEATEVTEGEETRTCSRCDATETRPTDKLECPSEKFEDMDQSQWYHSAIDYALVNNIFSGLDDTHFGPNVATTRAMFVAVLWRLEGRPESTSTTKFEDVPEKEYYARAVAWATENKIVYGIDSTHFNPKDNVTREQVAAFLYRYAKTKGYDLTADADLSKYPDSDKVSDYATTNLSWAVGHKLIAGNADKDGIIYLDSKGTATRAQVARILMMFEQNIAE